MLLAITEGQYLSIKDRDKVAKKAYYYLYTYRPNLSVQEITNPLTGSREKRLMFHDSSSQKSLIVLKNEEKKDCIKFFYERSKGEGARKLRKRIAEVFSKIAEREIQDYINNSSINQVYKCKYENKAPLKPVTSLAVWERVQIDLMSMADIPCNIYGKTYQWILSCIDVFSRYLVLRPLHSKDTAVVSEHLLQIFSDFGTPSVIQSDRGSEFMGSVNKVAKLLQVKMIHSSVRHPQSQGKVSSLLFLSHLLLIQVPFS